MSRGGTDDPMSLLVDWKAAPDPLAVCLLLLTKLTLDQLTKLHTYMQHGIDHKHSPLSSAGTYKLAQHACTLAEFCEAYIHCIPHATTETHRQTIEDRLTFLFHHYDVNHDNTLSFDELTVLKDRLCNGAVDEEDSTDMDVGGDLGSPELDGGGRRLRRDMVTIYDEVAIAIPWESARTARIVGMVPDWGDCSHVQFHQGLRLFTVCWKNEVILFDVALSHSEDNTRNPIAHEERRPTHANPVAIIRGHLSPIVACLYVPHIRRLFTSGTDRQLFSWNEQESWSRGERVAVSCAQISLVYDPASQCIFSGGTDGGVYLYPTVPKFGQPIKRIEAHSAWVTDLVIIQDLELLVSCSADSTMKFFSTASLELRTTKSSPQHSSGFHSMRYTRKDRTIYTAVSGREVLMWSPFLPKPADTLRGHEKPIVGLLTFDQRPEVLTSDLSGKICVWDMRTSTIVQVLGAPDSMSPIGAIHSFAYHTHHRYVTCLGERGLHMFVPQQGCCSSLMDSPVQQLLFDSVHKRVIVSSGGRIIVFELTTGEPRHAHDFGGAEISALACAVQQQLLIGTEEGRLLAVTIGSWRQSVSLHGNKHPIRLVVDLGKKSRLSATGVCPKALAVTSKGALMIFNYGAAADEATALCAVMQTEFVGLERAAYVFKHAFVVLSRKAAFEVWDVENHVRKTSQVLPFDITAVHAVDEVQGVFFGTSDGSLHCYHSASCVPLFVVKLHAAKGSGINPNTSRSQSPIPLRRASLAWRGSDSNGAGVGEFVPTRMVFDRAHWTLAVMAETETKLVALDTLAHRMTHYHVFAGLAAQYHHLVGSMKHVHKHRYFVDINPKETQPTAIFACLNKFHEQIVLSLSAVRALPRERECDLLARIQRWKDLREKQLSRARASPLADHSSASLRDLIPGPLDLFVPLAADRLETTDSRTTVYVITMNIPSQRRHYPMQHLVAAAVQEMNALAAAEALKRSSPKRTSSRGGHDTQELSKLKSVSTLTGNSGIAEHTTANTPAETSQHSRPPLVRVHSQSSAAQLIAEVKWMVVCVARALQALRQEGMVAVFHPTMVRYMAPNYVLFCLNGLWVTGDNATGALSEPELLPPEGLLQVTPAADMWMLGTLLFTVVTGLPFPGVGLTATDGIGPSASVGGAAPTHSATEGSPLMSIEVDELRQRLLGIYRHDALILKLLHRMLVPQPTRRVSPTDVLLMLEGFLTPPRSLVCIPLTVGEGRHEVFVTEEDRILVKSRVTPALALGSFHQVAVCEAPALLILAEFSQRSLSAHVVLWNHAPSLVGVTPPNSSVDTTYHVDREEVGSIRDSRLTHTDITVLDDPALLHQGIYRVERYCPFFAEIQHVSHALGESKEPLPVPYYLEGWHKTKSLKLDKPMMSQKQRDKALAKRWEDARATTKATSFEKTLITAQSHLALKDSTEERGVLVEPAPSTRDVERPVSGGVDATAGEVSRDKLSRRVRFAESSTIETQQQQLPRASTPSPQSTLPVASLPQAKKELPSRKPLSNTVTSTGAMDDASASDDASPMDPFLFSRSLNPHWYRAKQKTADRYAAGAKK